MKSFYKIFGVLIAVSLALTACNLPSSKNTPTVNAVDSVRTAAAETVSAVITQRAQMTAGVSTLAPATQTLPTMQPALTNTPAIPSSTLLPPTETTAPIPCNRGVFVKDMNVPDGTSFAPGTAFTKTWQVKNTGRCSWTTSYKLVFDSGNAMQAPASVAMPREVKPGELVDISVNLVSPANGGTYEGKFKFQDAEGNKFGLGDSLTDSIWVKIVVGTAAAPFAVTTIAMSATPSNFTGACPVSITFNGEMKVTAPGTVTYYWEFSDGTKGAEQSLVFSEAGQKTVTTTWNTGTPGQTLNGSAKIYVNHPNHQYFSNAAFTLTCNP